MLATKLLSGSLGGLGGASWDGAPVFDHSSVPRDGCGARAAHHHPPRAPRGRQGKGSADPAPNPSTGAPPAPAVPSRAGQGDKIPFISTAVAISNLTQLSHLSPVGLYDLAKVSGDVELGEAGGDEAFKALMGVCRVRMAPWRSARVSGASSGGFGGDGGPTAEARTVQICTFTRIRDINMTCTRLRTVCGHCA